MLLLTYVVGFLFAYASYTDTRSLIIRNWVSLTLILAYLLRWVAFPTTVEPFQDFVWLGAAFLVGFGLFHLGWFGGGDIKILIAGTLWFGSANALDFLLLAALLGGAESLIIVLCRYFRPMLMLASVWVPVLVADTKVIPYGIAISLSAIVVLFQQLASFGVI